MIRKIIIPALAFLGFLFALKFTFSYEKEERVPAPVAAPAASSFDKFISGSGIVEPNSENIAVGASVPGVVTQLFVQVGSDVKAGDPLFLIDDREARAQVASKESEVAAAASAVTEAEAQLADGVNQLQVARTLAAKEAGSVYVRDRKQFSVKVAQARLDNAKNQHALAEAQLEQARTNLELHTVKAPIDGQVLKMNLRLGEYAAAGILKDPLILLGNVTPLHVRVDIDENDAWRFVKDARAEGALRGNREIKSPLSFVRIEPYVGPKKSLTGDSAERVDTRVLQVIYRIEASDIPVYVGQLMDVFIAAAPPADKAAEAQP